MKHYNAIILTNEELKEIIKCEPEFNKEFLNLPDNWIKNLLEQQFQKPLINIRLFEKELTFPLFGKENFNEVILLFAKGFISNNTRQIHGDYDYCLTTITDILIEVEKDKREVFSQYSFPNLTEGEYRKLKKHVYTTY